MVWERRSGKPIGFLHGIPVAVKDIIGTVEMPTECGTSIRKGKSYSQNAEIIDLLISEGAIVMGKTATSELAFLGPPKTTHPHDYSRTPGGSSSGSAAAVASYMAPLSIKNLSNFRSYWHVWKKCRGRCFIG